MVSARRLVRGLGLVLLAGCASEAAAPSADSRATTFVLSAPIPADRLHGTVSGGTVVFVSASPGTFPVDAEASLRVAGRGAMLPLTMLDGGFDAAGLPASVGDTVQVVVDTHGTPQVVTQAVKAPARPKVVRVSPGPRRTDVPLNIVIRVEFSAPMDAGTIVSGIVLHHGDSTVAGSVRLVGPNGTAAEFTPADPLQEGTEYRLELSTLATDVLGQPLAAPVDVTFSTATSAVRVGSIVLDGIPATLMVAESLDVHASVCGAYYTPCNEQVAPVSWSSSSASVRTDTVGPAIAGRARVVAREPGWAYVTAEAGGVRDSMRVQVVSALPAASVADLEVVFASPDSMPHLYASRGDGTGLTRLTWGTSESEPSVGRDGRIVYVDGWQHLAIRDVDGSTRRLPAWSADGTLQCPTWSPDMRAIAYLERRPEGTAGVWIMSLDEPTPSARLVVSGAGCPSWSPDGTRLSIEQYGGPYAWAGSLWAPGSLRAIDWPTSAEATWTTLLGAAYMDAGRWSPSGDAIAAVVNDWQPLLWVERVSLVDGSSRRIWPMDGLWGPADSPSVSPWFVSRLSVPSWSPDGRFVLLADLRGVWIVDANAADGRWSGRFVGKGTVPALVPPGVHLTH